MKKLLILIIVLAGCAGAFLHFGPDYASKKIEQELSKELKTPVKIKNLTFNFKNPGIHIEALAVKNYSQLQIKNTLILKNIDLNIEPKSVFDDKIFVNNLSIRKIMIRFPKEIPLDKKYIKFSGFGVEDMSLRKDHLTEDVITKINFILFKRITKALPIEYKAYQEAIKMAREGKNLYESGRRYFKSKEFKDEVKNAKKNTKALFKKLGSSINDMNAKFEAEYDKREPNKATEKMFNNLETKLNDINTTLEKEYDKRNPNKAHE